MSAPMISKKQLLLRIGPDPHHPGKLRSDTALWCVENVDPSQPQALCAPLMGSRWHIVLQIDPETPDKDELLQEVRRILIGNKADILYSRHNYEVFANFYDNLQYLLQFYIPKNLLMQARGLESLRHEMAGRRVLYCGAGPSLNEPEVAAEIERSCKDPATVVVAGGSAIRIFAARGWEPDYILALDPYESEYWTIFHTLDEQWMRRQRAILYMSLEPRCFARCVENCKSFHVIGGMETLPYLQRVGGFDETRTGLSVTTTMVSLADALGVRHLALAGVDLAYDLQDACMYADGAGKVPDDAIPHGPRGELTKKAWIEEAEIISRWATESDVRVHRLGHGGLTLQGIGRISTLQGLEQLDREPSRPGITWGQWVQDRHAEWPRLDAGLITNPADAALEESETYELLYRGYDQYQQAIALRDGMYNTYLLEAVRGWHVGWMQKIRRHLEAIYTACFGESDQDT